MVCVHRFLYHRTLLLWNTVSSKWMENSNSKYSALFKPFAPKGCSIFAWKRWSWYCNVHARWSNTANPVKEFLIQTFGEERIISKRCKFSWPPQSPDLTPVDFWLWGIFKIPCVSIPSIQSVGSERYDPPRAFMYRAGDSAQCRCWICDTHRKKCFVETTKI